MTLNSSRVFSTSCKVIPESLQRKARESSEGISSTDAQIISLLTFFRKEFRILLPPLLQGGSCSRKQSWMDESSSGISAPIRLWKRPLEEVQRCWSYCVWTPIHVNWRKENIESENTNYHVSTRRCPSPHVRISSQCDCLHKDCTVLNCSVLWVLSTPELGELKGLHMYRIPSTFFSLQDQHASKCSLRVNENFQLIHP